MRMLHFQAIKSPQFQYSHFVSIPLALHPQLLESVKAFQKTVLEFDDGKINQLVFRDIDGYALLYFRSER